ncbi:MAG: TonB-dependent receptor, partial [Balneola sp.]|nr:TonB-dependent receptor [Balneola sp.]
MFCFSIGFAGVTGKIRGKVYDSETNEPLVGCNIIINQLSIGTATDFNGDFIIMNVKPGTYTISISMIGYSDYIFNELQINSDLTTDIDVPMRISALEGATIVVNANNNKINKNLTSTTAIITSDKIDKLPINEVSDIISIQAGFV